MITLTPVYRAFAEKELSQKSLMRILRHSFENVLGFGAATRRLVFSDDEAILGLAGRMGLTPLSDPGPIGSVLPLPDAEGMECLKRVLPQADEPVMLIDHRNPALAPALLEAFAAAYSKSPDRPLISVRACHDHPCQYFQARSLVDSGVMAVCLPTAAGLFASNYLPPELIHLYELEFNDSLFRFRVEEGGIRLEVSRRLAGTEKSDGECVLVGLGGNERPLFSILVNGRNAHFLEPAPLTTDNLIVSFYFPKTKICLDTKKNTFSFPEDIDDLSNEVVGGFFTITRNVENGYADQKKRYQPPNANWKLVENALFNKRTGTIIGGRQGFPAAYEEDGSLMVSDIHNGIDDMHLSAVACYPLSDGESMIISTEFDVIRYEVNRKWGAPC